MNTTKTLYLLTLFLTFSASLTAQYTPGTTYFDATGYVEYRAGNLPIIISAPHGGSLEPASIPDRNCSGCVYTKDSWTQTIAEGMYDEFVAETGCYPHLIINLLHRKKFDANRDIGDAADGNTTVEQAWAAYHDFIDAAKAKAEQDYGAGLFLDIHGHAHTIQRIELGYLISGSELGLSDAALNTNTYIEESSIRTLAGTNIQSLSHAELLRGSQSFGTLMDNRGFPSVPSAADPFPQSGDPYFSGGYNTVRHGSRDDAGNIDAVQIELNQDARFISANREMLIDSLTASANEYFDFHYNDQYLGNFCNLILPVDFLTFEAETKAGQVLLTWTSDTETNNDYFEVERSSGNTFTSLARIEGQGTSQDVSTYTYTDIAPLAGKQLYRLKQVDFDGSFSYSEVISVELNPPGHKGFVLSPNPASRNKVKLRFTDTKPGRSEMFIHDITGRVLYQSTVIRPEGDEPIALDISDLTKGLYLVKVRTERQQYTQKLVVE